MKSNFNFLKILESYEYFHHNSEYFRLKYSEFYDIYKNQRGIRPKRVKDNIYLLLNIIRHMKSYQFI